MRVLPKTCRNALTAAVVLAACSTTVLAPVRAAEAITGYATAYDGDRIDIRGKRVHLAGIDAPEPAQTCADPNEKLYACGRKAETALQDKIAGQRITCSVPATDESFPAYALCRLGEEDLSAWLVDQGLALADRNRVGTYVAQEDAARQAKRGIWAGSFTRPSDWRNGARGKPDGYAKSVAGAAPVEPARTAADERARACAIKGNITREGSKLYWVPGSRRYNETIITEASGERWFCTEEEARAAGWEEPQKEAPGR